MAPEPRTEAREPADALMGRDPEALIAGFRNDLGAGRPWLDALLDVVAHWDVPAEQVDGRDYRYLIGGEAFDWLLLAERLCEALHGHPALPQDEVDALLLHERFPQPLDEAAFKAALGPAKYRAHLNFIYGVRVEEALQLAVEQEVQKERRSGVTGLDARIDEDVFQRIYGGARLTLLAEYRSAHDRPMTGRISLSELKDFTYWLFKRRVQIQDPARVASDTRRALELLNRLEELKRRRFAPAAAATQAGVIDARAFAVR